MLYEEFVEGTGCRDNADNYKVYKDLEIMYMNSEMTKQEIYEYGKKLVNNGLTEKQIAWNADIDRQIAELNEKVEYYKSDIDYNKNSIEYWKNFDRDMVDSFKRSLKWDRQQLNYYKNQIRNLKSCKYV